MLFRPIKSIVVALALMFTVAPFALAGGQSATSAAGQKSQQHYGQSQTGMQDHQAISATVEEVDQEEKSLSLRLDDGKTVDLQVPEAMLSTLQKGDSVEVSIRKADKGQTPGMGGSQPSQPGMGGTTQPGQSR